MSVSYLRRVTYNFIFASHYIRYWWLDVLRSMQNVEVSNEIEGVSEIDDKIG